jgi:long-chain acyl-CoA synthetase
MGVEKNVADLITNRVKRYGGKLLFQRREGWSWKQVTWLDFEREVKSIASFLMDLGFGQGDMALVVSSNRIESILTEIAIHLLGGVTIPIAEDEPLEDVVRVTRDLKIKFVFTGGESTLDRILNVSREITGLERVFVFSEVGLGKGEIIIPFKGILKFGSLRRRQLEDELVRVSKGVLPDSIATVFFQGFKSDGEIVKKETTQMDLIQALYSASERLSFIHEEDQAFSYLPSAGPFEKLINHLGLYMGTRIVMAEKREDFFSDIVEVKPTVLFETKRGLEELCSRVLSESTVASPDKRLKNTLGGRIKYVLTDSLPGREIIDLFSRSGVSLIDVPELSNISA